MDGEDVRVTFMFLLAVKKRLPKYYNDVSNRYETFRRKIILPAIVFRTMAFESLETKVGMPVRHGLLFVQAVACQGYFFQFSFVA